MNADDENYSYGHKFSINSHKVQDSMACDSTLGSIGPIYVFLANHFFLSFFLSFFFVFFYSVFVLFFVSLFLFDPLYLYYHPIVNLKISNYAIL